SGPNEEYGTDIAVDRAGNAYIAGYFFDTVDFDPGPGIQNLTATPSQPFSSPDAFVWKLTASGDYSWAKRVGGLSVDLGSALAVDGTGGVTLVGTFADTVDFDPGPGTLNLTSNGLLNTDAFIWSLRARADVIGRTSTGQWWAGANYNGNSFTSQVDGQWNEGLDWRDVLSADFNGDGTTDVAGRTSTGQWWVGLSGAGGLVFTAWASWN